MGADKVPRRGEPGVAVRPAEVAEDRTLPGTAPLARGAEAPQDTDRVRRPADLLLAVISFLIVAAVLGNIKALPLGSTEAADDVSKWLLHIPRWLSYAAAVGAGVACFALAAAALVVLARSSH